VTNGHYTRERCKTTLGIIERVSPTAGTRTTPALMGRQARRHSHVGGTWVVSSAGKTSRRSATPWRRSDWRDTRAATATPSTLSASCR